ncbi:cation:proton antiporter [Amycolatopsis mediterranei]|uniref:cation:proton antiporter n=1 Tax=Amycolatopsis mediterranei TaxID=33910 RepID=UPI001E586993|nr:cation:proton antiporter [Amycolatopsis mediterranei]UZF74863.1 cation:proton antiporter [Amycolatopsis mediterranei]
MKRSGGSPGGWTSLAVPARVLALLPALALGVVVAAGSGLDVAHSRGYPVAVTVLLAIGLYASTHGIDVAEFRNRWKTVLVAVTIGVFVKAALISAVMFAFYREPYVLLLAIAMAQIDPLSVAAMRAKSRMSEQGKALLAAWAAFDDPVTVLLTAYLTAAIVPSAGAGPAVLPSGLAAAGVNFLANAALVVAVWLVRVAVRSRNPASAAGRRVRAGLEVVLLLACGTAAVHWSLLLGLAVTGLFLRPDFGAVLDRAVTACLVLAAFAVGLVLAGGVRIVPGIVLGTAAYGAQVVVALLLTAPRAWRADRAKLALGQQNGLTALVLALVLEPVVPVAVATVGPAILVVNLWHAAANGVWDRRHRFPRICATRAERSNEVPHAEHAG